MINERIRELAQQAGFQYIKDERIGWAGNYNSSLPKFAELLIRECCDCCDLLLNDTISSEWSRGTHDCSRAIKKHFGVEK